MNDKIMEADKELKKTKRWISFMLFGIALGSGNLMWGIATDRVFSVISGIFCGLACGICAWRMLTVVERYARMSEMEKQLAEMRGFMNRKNLAEQTED